MKRAFTILSILGCAAALAACSKEEEPAVIILKAGQHTISLGVDGRPDTRVSYSYQEEENVYEFSWSEGDAIGVYIPGREDPVEYIIAEGIGSKKATFTLAEDCSVASGQQTVSIVYPYSTDNSFALPKNTGTCGIETMGNFAVLYAKEVPMTDGEIGDAALKPATSYLHFPAGFVFFEDNDYYGCFLDLDMADEDNNCSGTLETPFRVFSFETLEPIQSNAYSSTTLSFTITLQGTLADDVYIPFFVPEGGAEMQLKWSMALKPYNESCYYDSKHEYTSTPLKTMMPGMVYTGTAGTFPKRMIYFEQRDDDYHYEPGWDD
jgi:hypothetical protein